MFLPVDVGCRLDDRLQAWIARGGNPFAARGAKGDQLRVNQVDLVDIDAGGTARGAYAAGLLQRLFAGAPQLAQHVQILSGTSTGSLIAPMLGL